MADEGEEKLHIMVIDCCEHAVAAFETVRASRLTSVSLGLRGNAATIERTKELDLIVIGVADYPVRRLFVSQIRAAYPDVPMLILRRVDGQVPADQMVRGEFILGDHNHERDLEIVQAVRKVLPLRPCTHTPKEFNYNLVRDVMRVISGNYSDPNLDLEKVASAVPISSAQLSRILNQSVGISFRQLLRNTRIEEAKRLLASNLYSVKEVAALVGFADSHYFSRSFKALTGQSATEFRPRDAIFGA
ncbi:MAG TPA: helix-turn-helix transcriptional regulator [Pyrinomonadaceae bacterium]